MTKTKFLISLYLLILQNCASGVEVFAHDGKHGFEKLFVFGDSYADTGNGGKDSVASWKEPYGITFPGNPTGRWSDGRVMTDLFASFLGLHSPEPYQLRNRNPENNGFAVVIIDIYEAFTTVIRSRQQQGRKGFEKPLQPCCVGVSSEFGCGSVDGSGAKKYTVCAEPESSLFWDNIHPSDGGWAAISSFIQATIEKLY
ncbi:GDSL esterase/lipase At5g03610-like [Aristolochia californica]|uniref:GDSL esterase/lipase At5g03610-like n=1 Tax=Aristolochia californica TaxID=171875 RepID=UPI0035D79CC4